ncbi:hypothetical protein BDW74DRAFT_103035 [Aspergillus multicolor]|uniref:uncharacterized protein n=1 Tax=Aspergillus multicolor TaxID=41759 RepID=UPI003CCDD851
MSAKDRLRRSKSTRFARPIHGHSLISEPFDPELARLFATAAASRAMAMSRSADRTSTLSEGSYGRIGGPHSMAVPPRRYKRSTYTSGCSPAGDDPPSRHRPLSSIDSPDNDQSWSAALPSISEFGGVEDRIASLPSSYRRLRKSRSMFSTRQRSSHIPYGLTSPDSYSPSISSRGPHSDTPRLYRTLRRSMSFLRGENHPENTLRHARSQDVSIQLARSQYQQNLMSSPDSTWAPLSMPKTRHKPFRKTCRGASASDGTSIAEASLKHVRGSHSLGKARAFSSTIKKGIKRVLGLSRTVSEQEKAHTSPSSSGHWARSPSTVASNENNYPSGHGPIDSHIQGQTDAQPTAVRRMKSSASLAMSRSRVTSWADSTAANTITTPRTSAQHRLSVVSQPGNLGRPEVPPLPTGPIRHGPNQAVDSHRLFSALMKRIGGANAQASDEDIIIGQVKEHRAVPTQGSLTSHHSKRTVRQVSSEVPVNSPRSFATANAGPTTPYEQPRNHGASRAHSGARTVDAYKEGPKASEEDISRVESASSVYSRSIDGHSPCKAPPDSPGSTAEPGVATIYASERTAYSSPKKFAESPRSDVPTLPATDWQHWMDSQMARIESATPTGHYRENADICGDYASSFTSSVPNRRIRVESRGAVRTDEIFEEASRKLSTSSNFSRPFSRSSSLRTVAKARSPSIPPLLADDVFQDAGGHDRFLKCTPVCKANFGVSPMLSRSSNQPRMNESPTPKRSTTEISPVMTGGKYAQYPTKRSPGAHDARQLHRRSARFIRENRRATNENARLEQGMYDQAGGLQSQPMSSKRMVEIFLNSRRRQMGLDTDEGTSEPAFL